MVSPFVARYPLQLLRSPVSKSSANSADAALTFEKKGIKPIKTTKKIAKTVDISQKKDISNKKVNRELANIGLLQGLVTTNACLNNKKRAT